MINTACFIFIIISKMMMMMMMMINYRKSTKRLSWEVTHVRTTMMTEYTPATRSDSGT